MEGFVAASGEPLQALEGPEGFFVGRKKSLHEKFGGEGALLFGKSLEKQAPDKKVFVDALSPHTIFVCGSKGSGKSYSLSVMAEELVTKNPSVACVVVDPVGIFWSMKYPNKDEKELRELVEWGLEPKGIEKTQVFVPAGLAEKVPRQTYDKLFTIKTNELTVDELCLTFGLERFSLSGLLIERAIEKAGAEFKDYSIDELIKIIETDKELTSKERGYKQDTRRAIISRLEAAKSWGIMSREGTSLSELCKEGWVSVIDISFLEENVASLVIGLVARKILNARKMVARQAAIGKYKPEDVEEVLNVEIPPTWLFIDEAHTLIPSGNAKTAATDSLIEYVKQGRRPGCSLVFATQQPAAIDTRVLSQLDLVICHKLTFDEDLRAVMKRMPTVMPTEYEKTRFLKTLPIGIALVGDRSEETSRAFCVKVRPRFSQHEGRETRSIETEEKIDPAKLGEFVVRLVSKKIAGEGRMSVSKIEETCATMARRYGIGVKPAGVLEELKKQGFLVSENEVIVAGFVQKRVVGVKAVEKTVSETQAKRLADKMRKKKSLGLFGDEEKVKSVRLVYEPLYKIEFDAIVEKGFRPATLFADEDFNVYYFDKALRKHQDVEKIIDFDEKRMKVLRALPGEAKKIAAKTGLSESLAARYAREFVERGLAVFEKKEVKLKKKLDVPARIDSPKYDVSQHVKISAPENADLRPAKNEALAKTLPELFGRAQVKSVEVLYKPVWEFVFESKQGVRVDKADAF